MSKHCPRWVYMTVVAQACYDYVTLDVSSGLLIISHKYDNGLKEIYDDLDLPKIDTVALEFLPFVDRKKTFPYHLFQSKS